MWFRFVVSTVVIGLASSTQGAVLLTSDFSSSDQGWSGNGSWAWSAVNGRWETPGADVTLVTTLTSPIITATGAGYISGSMTHSFRLEEGYDGGRLEFSVNGGAWNVIAQNLVTGRSYTGAVTLGDWNQQIDGAVFTGISDHSPGPSIHIYTLSNFQLGTGGAVDRYQSGGVPYLFTAGDTVQFRLLSSWGDDYFEADANWAATEVSFSLAPVPEPEHAAAACCALVVFAMFWAKKRQHR